MKFEKSVSGKSLQLSALDADRWDGTPLVDSFVMDYVPNNLNSDRLAVAFTLLFGNYLGGSIHFPQMINMVTASAVQEYLSPAKVFIDQVEDNPAVVEYGVNRIVMEPDLRNAQIEIIGDQRMVHLLDRSAYQGFLGGHRQLMISSNRGCFETHGQSLCGFLASAVLLAGDLEAGAVHIQGLQVSDEKYLRYYNLLNSVGLKLA